MTVSRRKRCKRSDHPSDGTIVDKTVKTKEVVEDGLAKKIAEKGGEKREDKREKKDNENEMKDGKRDDKKEGRKTGNETKKKEDHLPEIREEKTENEAKEIDASTEVVDEK